MWSALLAGLWVLGGAIVAMSGTRYHGVFAVFLFILGRIGVHGINK